MEKIDDYIKIDFAGIQITLDLLFKNLDPSLFQNITLAVLAIFIPFAIVFLTDILNSKKRKSEFEKMVLTDEVLGTKKIFWLAIISIVFFAFHSGTQISTLVKIATTSVAIFFIFLFWLPFQKILRFSEGHKSEFEMPFLKKLGFSKVFKFMNKSKGNSMFRAWDSFWSEKSEIDERSYTRIYISHIDGSIKLKKFDFAVQLGQIYTTNIEKRDRFSISYEILPKVFEWSELLWCEHQRRLRTDVRVKRIQNFFSQKHFPTFRNWVLKLNEKFDSNSEHFWNWHYFRYSFFQAIIKILLEDGSSSYELFSAFKKYVEESEKKLCKITDEKKKEKYRRYIDEVFASFCPTFFNEIKNTSSSYGIWQNDFPSEWKITITNRKNRISRIILHEFLRWSEDRIFREESANSFDEALTEVINGIFPNIDATLFTAFFMLYLSPDVKQALEKKPNFLISGTGVAWSSAIYENEVDRNTKLDQMMKEKINSQKEETIQIIVNFFHFWQILAIHKDNLNEQEFKNWNSYSEENRKRIVRRVRKKKLKMIKKKVESSEILEFCKESELKELYRKDILELIELLIMEVAK